MLEWSLHRIGKMIRAFGLPDPQAYRNLDHNARLAMRPCLSSHVFYLSSSHSDRRQSGRSTHAHRSHSQKNGLSACLKWRWITRPSISLCLDPMKTTWYVLLSPISLIHTIHLTCRNQLWFLNKLMFCRGPRGSQLAA